jgi:hypothetical protein
MLRDGILEESYSAYVNPLTPVHREQKPIRICEIASGFKNSFSAFIQALEKCFGRWRGE